MKTHHTFICLIIAVAIRIYAEAQLEEVYNFCNGIQHESYFDYTCCNNEMFSSGINLVNGWKNCAALNKTEENNVNESMWRMYTCIIQGAMSFPINLTTFATSMTSTYSEDIKEKIMNIVGQTDLQENIADAESLTIDQLNAIRVTYHNIERGVCEGKYVKRTLKSLTSCKSSNDMIRENQHSRGDCCNNQQIPITLTYLRRPPSKKIQTCTLTWIVTGGTANMPLSSDARLTSEQIENLKQYNDDIMFNMSDAQQTCIQACTTDKKVEEALSYAQFNFTLAEQEALEFLPENLAHKTLEHMTLLSNKTLQEQVDDFLNANLEEIVLREFTSSVNMTLLRRLFTTCEAHNLLTRQIESSFYEMCRVK